MHDEGNSFYADLRDKMLAAVSNGRHRLVLWGFTPACIRLLTDLKQAGLLERCVAGVIDSNPDLTGTPIFHYAIQPPEAIAALEMDTLVVVVDADKEAILRRFIAVDGRTVDILTSGTQNYRFRDPLFEEVLASCPIPSQALGYPHMLIHIFQSLVHLVTQGVTGHVAELGAFQCGTTIFMAETLRRLNCDCTVHAFDTFDGFPAARSALDMYAGKRCEFHGYELIRHYCAHHPNIRLVRGDISKTYTTLQDVPLMFSFFDTDNYFATRTALGLFYRQTVPGGILAFDHYCSDQFPKTLGERLAVQEALRGKRVFNLHGTGIFIKGAND